MAITRTRSYGPASDGCIKLTISCNRIGWFFDSPPAHASVGSPLSFSKRGGSTRLRGRGWVKNRRTPIAWNSKFDTAIGRWAVKLAFGYRPLQEYSPPVLKGKQQFAFIHRRLSVIFKELVCIAKINTQDDNLGESQSFWIAVIDHALSPVILTKEGSF